MQLGSVDCDSDAEDVSVCAVSAAAAAETVETGKAAALADNSARITANYNTVGAKYREQIESLAKELLGAQNAVAELHLRVNTANLTIQELHAAQSSLLAHNEALQIQLQDVTQNLTHMENSYEAQLEITHSLQEQNSQMDDIQSKLLNQVDVLEGLNKSVQDQAQAEISSLKSQIQALSEANASLEESTQTKIDKVSNYLYVQYSQKHEAKVAELKSLYKAKLNARDQSHLNTIESLKSQVASLNNELNYTKTKLGQETAEKQKLIKLWDDYNSPSNDLNKENTNANSNEAAKELKGFVKSIK